MIVESQRAHRQHTDDQGRRPSDRCDEPGTRPDGGRAPVPWRPLLPPERLLPRWRRAQL